MALKNKILLYLDDCCRIVCEPYPEGPKTYYTEVTGFDPTCNAATLSGPIGTKRVVHSDVFSIEGTLVKCGNFAELFSALDEALWACKNDITVTVEPTEPEEGKCFVGTIYRLDKEDKCKVIAITVYKDNVTGMPCYFLESDISLTNPLTISEFMPLENSLGHIPNNPNAITEIPDSNGIDVCGGADGKTLTEADLQPFIDQLKADYEKAGGVFPDGAEFGLSSIIVQTFKKGSRVHCDIDDVDVTTTSPGPIEVVFNGDTDIVQPNGGKRKYNNQLLDPECTGCVKAECIITGLEVTIPANSAGHIDFCGICFLPAGEKKEA